MDIITGILKQVSASNLQDFLFYLSSDPLPCRTLNYTRPGAEKCTLYEADDFIAGKLAEFGIRVDTEVVPVQVFQPDTSVPHGFRKPSDSEPWYDAVNIYGKITGTNFPKEAIVLIAHKDSQSWLPCAPGAYDNGVGVASLLEMARLAENFEFQRSVIFLFPNEEHWPWTSVHAAQQLAGSDLDIIAALNVDSIGGKSAEARSAGKLTNFTRYSTPDGEKFADLMAELNDKYNIGLEQDKRYSRPNDDDGSFVNAGILNSVLNIGSFPYADPHYHSLGDKPNYVDIENVKKATQLSLAALLHIDYYGKASFVQ